MYESWKMHVSKRRTYALWSIPSGKLHQFIKSFDHTVRGRHWNEVSNGRAIFKYNSSRIFDTTLCPRRSRGIPDSRRFLGPRSIQSKHHPSIRSESEALGSILSYFYEDWIRIGHGWLSLKSVIEFTTRNTVGHGKRLRKIRSTKKRFAFEVEVGKHSRCKH